MRYLSPFLLFRQHLKTRTNNPKPTTYSKNLFRFYPHHQNKTITYPRTKVSHNYLDLYVKLWYNNNVEGQCIKPSRQISKKVI